MNVIDRMFAIKHADKNVDLDDPATTLLHQQIIKNKKFLRKIYEQWYTSIIAKLPQKVSGQVLEIGSGGGFFKKCFPEVITSDIMPLPHCDMVLDCQAMPFENESLKAIVMVNVFHHIPDCERFLREAQRTLKPGGKIIMVEPGRSVWSQFIYQKFHHEPFELNVKEWKFESSGPMSSSNQALPYIVFERDRAIFEKRFPDLHVLEMDYHTSIAYLLSGGVSKKTLVPSTLQDSLLTVDKRISNKRFHMFCTVEVEKKRR